MHVVRIRLALLLHAETYAIDGIFDLFARESKRKIEYNNNNMYNLHTQINAGSALFRLIILICLIIIVISSRSGKLCNNNIIYY